jgi:alkylated DNA repair dioxygenase AlkB
MVPTPRRPATRSQTHLRAFANHQQRIQQQRLLLAAVNATRRVQILQVQVEIARLRLERHQRQFAEPGTVQQDPEAGILNPPPPYAPRQVPWNTAAGLRSAFLAAVAQKAPQIGVQAPQHRPLSSYRHKFTFTTAVKRIPAPFHVTKFLTARLYILPPQGPVIAQTVVSVIERRVACVPQAVRVGGLPLQRVWRIKQVLPVSMKRGALDTFFKAAAPKKPKYEASADKSQHVAYPFAIPHLPAPFKEQLGFAPAEEGKLMNDQLDLDMVYYQPYIPSTITSGIFEFLRQELPFYRVQYNITRGNVQTQINTPRFTTVFGIDDTCRFAEDGSLVDAATGRKVEANRYKCKPRPIPQCLDELRKVTEGSTGETFNFCLVNYYADGKDSISYHSDDERFLGPNPAIASLSLGAKRDFLMKHKPIAPNGGAVSEEPKGIKLSLGPGDMVLMRGRTQGNWLHSIPKRAGADANKGRINITFRKAMVKGGTENYYQYNVGSGGVFKWDGGQEKMAPWDREAEVVEARGNGEAVAGGSNVDNVQNGN